MKTFRMAGLLCWSFQTGKSERRCFAGFLQTGKTALIGSAMECQNYYAYGHGEL